MKKFVSLIVLFSCGHICANAYESLKAAQAKFHGLIYQGGALPDVAGSAPEVAYVAGFFYPPITLPADQESNEIYRALINKGTNKDPRHGSRGVDGSNLQQFNALDLSALGRYNEYASNDSANRQSVTGHSVLGIAAQHPRMVIAAPPPPIVAAVASSPAVSSSSSSSGAAAKAPAMTMAGGGFPFGRPAQKAAVPDTSVPGFEAVGVKLNEINSKLRKFKNDEADTRILKELEGELLGSGKAGTAVQQARFQKLVIAFNYINKQEEGDELTALRKELVPEVYAAAAVAAEAAPAPAVPREKRLTLNEEIVLRQSNRAPNADKQMAAAIAAIDLARARADKNDPVKAAIEQCVNGEMGGISAIDDNRKAIGEAIHRLQILGDSATDIQKIVLKFLIRRLHDTREDPGQKEEEDDDDEFGPVRKNSSITSTPLPVPAQAAVTNAPAFNPTSTVASGSEERYLTTEELDAIPGLQKFKKTQYSNDKGNGLPPEKAREKLGAGVTAKFVGDAVVVAAAPAAVSAPAPVAAQLTVAGNTGSSSPMVRGGAVVGLSPEEKAAKKADLQKEIDELKAKIESGTASIKEKTRLTVANTELSKLG